MNCQQVHEHIERYYEGALPVADELGVDIHLVQCAACAEELGGIDTLVEECHQAFDGVTTDCDIEGLHAGMVAIEKAVAHQHWLRARFRRKDVAMHLIFALVALPVFLILSVKFIETYSAYAKFLPVHPAKAEAREMDTIPPHISRTSAHSDW